MPESPINKGNPMIVLIQDMNVIHEKTDLYIKEIDDKVNKSIALVQERKMAMLPHLEEIRVKLWIGYTQKNIEKIDKFIKELSVRLVKVADYRKQLNSIKRQFDSIRNESQDYKLLLKTQNLNNIINLFNESTQLWNNLADNEEDLRREAWFNFLSKIYLPFAAVASAGYWVIVQFIVQWKDLQTIILWLVIILGALYWLLFKLAKNPFKMEEKNE